MNGEQRTNVRDVDSDSTRLREDRDRLRRDIGERVKEIRCLYAVSAAIRAAETEDAMFRDVVRLIPPGWRSPERTFARIRFAGREYRSPGFVESENALREEIHCEGGETGAVEVFLRGGCEGESAFLDEERELLLTIARELGEAADFFRTENELRKNRDLFRRYFESPLVGMAITSPEKGWLRMNDRLCDLLGYSRKELSRMTWAEITHPDDLEADVAQFARLVNGEIDGYEMEKRFVRKDGKTVYTRLGVSCSRREDGSIDHVQAMLDDVSERKKLQAELETERRQLKTLFDAQDEAIYVSDPETFELLYANRVIRENWSEDAIGKKCYRVLQNRGEPCPFCTNGLIFQDGENRTHAWEFRNEVTGRWYRCVDKAIRWPDGRRVRFEIASDITEQKKLEEERVSLDKLSSLGRLAAGVAHELNNPLMGILNYAQYCLTVAEPGSRMNEVLRDIETETRRGLELVGNLLSFSRTKTGTGPHGGETRTPAVFRNVVKLLAYRIRNENVAVHEEFGPGAAQARVNGATVQQVLMNLLSNALDAVESAKTKEVRVAFRKEANALVLEVADTGCGIPPEVRERIFEPFYTTKPPGKGTGLGLSILGALVHDAGGRILCRSRPGEGTVMTVELPERTADPSKKTKKKSVRGKREENHP